MIIMVNELLKKLGHENILVVDKPVFNWDGNAITSDSSAPVKQVATFRLNDKMNFSDFLNRNSDKKIVFFNFPDGKLINDRYQLPTH